MILFDTLKNLVSGVGTAKDKSSHWRHVYRPLSQDEIEAAYAGDWLARKIVDIPPHDMTREWRTWETDNAEALYAAEKQFQIKSKVKRALVLRRLHGGSAILIGDGAFDPSQPLDPDQLPQGGLKYVHVFSQFELTPSDVIRDIENPAYGLPEFFSIRAENARSSKLDKIHRSRFVIMIGQESPPGLVARTWGWGQPLYQSILDAVNHVNTTAANAAALTEEAKVDVIQMDDLGTYLNTPDGTKRLVERFSMANTLKSMINTLVLGKGEKFERNSISFTGLTDLMRTHAEFVSGAADIPMTRLFGTSPAGMNATGESDIRNYYDKIRSEQTTSLQDDIEPLDRVLIQHVLGRRPPDVVYSWAPLWQLSQGEQADISLKSAQTDQIYINSGLFAPEELRGTIADKLIASGTYPTLDDNLLEPDDFEELMNPDPAVDPAADPNQEPQRPALRVVGADRRWSNDESPFDPSEHPKDPAGKFTSKFSAPPSLYPVAGSKIAVVKRIKKRLATQAAKNPKYRAYIEHMIKEAEHYGVLTPDVESALTKKIGESFYLEGQVKATLGKPSEANKLLLKSLQLGYKSQEDKPTLSPTPNKPLEAPPKDPSFEKLHPRGPGGKFTMKEKDDLDKAWMSVSTSFNSAVNDAAIAEMGQDAWMKLETWQKTAWALNKFSDVSPLMKYLPLSLAEKAMGLPQSGPSLTESADKWVKVGAQKGSNPGGFYKDPGGSQWYVKTPKTGEHVAQDLLANRLYTLADVDVPFEKPVSLGNKPAIASMVLGSSVELGKLSSEKREIALKKIREGFAVDAWLGNWDVVGLNQDNVVLDNGNNAWRIDTGGTLEFRAQGDKKSEFGADVKEFYSLRDPTLNPQSAAVFKDMTNDEMVASINKVLTISDAEIKSRVAETGASAHLADVLIKRKEFLAKKKDELLGKASPKPAISQPHKDVPLPSPDKLTKEQQTAAKSTGSPDPYAYSDDPVSKEQSKTIQAFNAKWKGKAVSTMGQLNEKMADYKAMKDKNLELQAKAEEIKAKAAKAEAEKQAEKYGMNDPKMKEAFAALGALTAPSHAKHYLEVGASALKSKGLDKYITPIEAAIIRAYTGSEVYGPLNKQLRENAATAQAFKYAVAFEVALRKLPNYTAEATRRTTIPPEEDKKFQPGLVHTEYGFMSASKNKGTWSGQHTLHITKSHTGSDVSSLSAHGSEAEVIYPRNTSFLITKRIGNEIWMEEIQSHKHILDRRVA